MVQLLAFTHNPATYFFVWGLFLSLLFWGFFFARFLWMDAWLNSLAAEVSQHIRLPEGDAGLSCALVLQQAAVFLRVAPLPSARPWTRPPVCPPTCWLAISGPASPPNDCPTSPVRSVSFFFFYHFLPVCWLWNRCGNTVSTTGLARVIRRMWAFFWNPPSRLSCSFGFRPVDFPAAGRRGFGSEVG